VIETDAIEKESEINRLSQFLFERELWSLQGIFPTRTSVNHNLNLRLFSKYFHGPGDSPIAAEVSPISVKVYQYHLEYHQGNPNLYQS